MDNNNEVIELDMTWEELEEQGEINRKKDNPPISKIKKYV